MLSRYFQIQDRDQKTKTRRLMKEVYTEIFFNQT